MPAATANETLRDALIRHQVRLQRLGAGLKRRIAAELNRTEPELRDLIERRLETLAARGVGVDVTTPGSLRRLEALMKAVEGLRSAAIGDAVDVLREEMLGLTREEAKFTVMQIDRASPVVVDLALPAVETLRALVSRSPFQGQTLADWAAKVEADDLHRIDSAVRSGLVQGLDSQEIGRSIVGTARLAGTDGVTQITRNNAVAIARTAVNFYSNAAKQEVYGENSDVIEEELFVATLDDRTTEECAANDGETYPVGEGPVPPLHWQCRSLRVAVLSKEALGTRPMKEATEADAVKAYAEENDLQGTFASREDLPHGHKGSFDDFSRAYVRDRTGVTPAATTYSEFLRDQTKAFQEEVLGATKAKLFRDGGLELNRFVDRQGNTLTLDQLSRKYRDAFVSAGLDPVDYRKAR